MIERKDVRAKLDPELHADLCDICEIDGIDIADFIEALLIPAIRKRCVDASELHARRERRGINGKNRE